MIGNHCDDTNKKITWKDGYLPRNINLPRQRNKETGRPNRTVINKEIESVIKNIPKRKVQDHTASLDESSEKFEELIAVY